MIITKDTGSDRGSWRRRRRERGDGGREDGEEGGWVRLDGCSKGRFT